jgi:hypothetical protein
MGKYAPDETVPTNLNLRGRHRNWADQKNKNLSAVVRDALDERMGDGDE